MLTAACPISILYRNRVARPVRLSSQAVMHFRPPSLAFAAVLLPVFASACADAQGDAGQGLPDLAARQAGAFRLTEVARSGEDAPFASITGIDPDSRGRIFVADWSAARIAVLRPDGRMEAMWGQKGLGPGEFRSLRGVQVIAGDSVLTFDPSAGRLTVFAPDGSAAYVRNLARSNPFLLWRLPGDDGYVAITRPAFRGGDTGPRLDEVWRLDAAGDRVGEPLRVFPSRSFLHVQQGGGFSVMPNPFGHEGFVAVGPRGVYLAWSDTLGVDIVSPSGEAVGGFSHAYAPPPVTGDDVRAYLADQPQQIREMFGRALADSAPDRWPPLRGMLVDDRGRIWLALPAPIGSEREWAAFDGGGTYLGSVFLPLDAEAWSIRHGRIYSATADSEVVVHEIGERRGGGTR